MENLTKKTFIYTNIKSVEIRRFIKVDDGVNDPSLLLSHVFIEASGLSFSLMS